MTFGALAGVALALGIVLALLAVAMRALHRLSGTSPAQRGGLPLHVVQRIALAPRQVEPLAQVHDGHDAPAQVDDALDERGRIRHARNIDGPDDLLHVQNVDAKFFVFDQKTDQLENLRTRRLLLHGQR